MTPDTFQRKLTAILSADVVGYSRLMSDDEEATVRTLNKYKRIIFGLIERHNGRLVDSPGDNVLAEFVSVVDAVRCAVQVQEDLKENNKVLPTNRIMEFRIGIHTGDVIQEGDVIYGDGVNVAARIESLADAGGICLSRTAHDQVKKKLNYEYEYLGEYEVKNIDEPVRVYRIRMELEGAQKGIEVEKTRNKSWRSGIIAVALIVVVLTAWAIQNFYSRDPSIEAASIENMAYPLPDKPSIAVLPFTNTSGDPEQEYIGDGLSENIISALSISSEIFVMSRGAMFTYKGISVKPQKVAEDLGVQYVLEGSILKSGERLRVTAQLVDALNGHQLWSEMYDRKMKELFELLDDVTKRIIVSLQVEVGDQGEDLRLYAKSTDNLEAWKHYIKGIELYENFNEEDNQKAREHFEAALELDPEFVAALSMLGETHIQDIAAEWSESPPTSRRRAFEFAQKALELDEQDPSAHAILGQVFLYQREHEKAILEGKRAITLKPNYAYGHAVLASIMHYSGRFDDAINLCKKASRINPDVPILVLYTQATSYIFLERYEEALETIRQIEEHAPSTRVKAMSKCIYATVYQMLGREEEARAYMAEGLRIKPDYSLENLIGAPYIDTTFLQILIDHSRKAGMPEKPPGAVQEKKTIAVLPFDNLSPDPEQGYFADGIAEELLNSLTRISVLEVRGRTSSLIYFKDRDEDYPTISEKLNVEYILEGSVRKAGEQVRITVQLINTQKDAHIWSETYERTMDDIFAIQDDIAQSVADALQITLGVGELGRAPGMTRNIAAYDAFLDGRSLYLQGGRENTSQAIEQLEQAVALDPDFAIGWNALANAYIQAVAFIPEKGKEFVAKSNAAYSRVVELIPETDLALRITASRSGDYVEVERLLKKALALNPTNYETNSEYESFLINMGRPTEGIDYIQRLLRMEPLSSSAHLSAGLTYAFSGNSDAAVKAAKKAKDLSNQPALYNGYLLVLALEDNNRALIDEYAALILNTEILGNINRSDTRDLNQVMHVLLDTPEEAGAELRLFLTDPAYNNPMNRAWIAVWASYFGEFELALQVCRESIGSDSTFIFQIWRPIHKGMRQLPGFKDLVRDLGLLDYWRTSGNWSDFCRPIGDDDFVCK